VRRAKDNIIDFWFNFESAGETNIRHLRPQDRTLSFSTPADCWLDLWLILEKSTSPNARHHPRHPEGGACRFRAAIVFRPRQRNLGVLHFIKNNTP